MNMVLCVINQREIFVYVGAILKRLGFAKGR